jgi:subtilisin family serine protease
VPVLLLRRASYAVAVLLVIGAVTGSALAGPSGTARSQGAAPHVLRELPASSREGARIDPLVPRRLARRGSVEAIVTLNGSSVLADARAAAAGDSRALLRATVPAYRVIKDGLRSRVPRLQVLEDYPALPILFVRISTRVELARLAADPSVSGIETDRRNRAVLAQSLPLVGQPAAAAAGHTGAGTAVAVLDTGVDYTHAAFGSCAAPGTPAGCRVVLAQDTAPNDGQLDADGHGTNVSGIVVGVAPGTSILALDVFDGNVAFNSDIIEGIDLSIANQATFNVRAINMSLGVPESYSTSPCTSSNPFVSAFSNARAAGILPVISAGNSAFANGSFHVGISMPACTPGAIPVGAVYDSNIGPRAWGGPGPEDVCSDPATAADQITCFSQSWASPMLLAPGALITAAGITFGGTSQAAPHVAGAVAVLHDAAGVAVTPTQVETALLSSGPLIFDDLINQSVHRLDLPAAITALGVQPPPTTPPPTTTPPPGGGGPPPSTTPPPTTPPPTTTTAPPTACSISGTQGDDLLVGTSGDDVICGEDGSDVILAGGGNDVVIGGAGSDRVSLEDATGGAAIDLTAGTATAPGVHVTLQEIEGAIGSPFADSILGDAGSNDLWGLGGDDTIDGAGGFDYARYDSSTRRIRADLALGTAAGEGRDVLSSIEGLVGSNKDDELRGNDRVNVIYGIKGDDLVVGFGRADSLFGGPGVDSLFGGRGNDEMFGGPGVDLCDQGPGSGTASSC